MFLIIYTDGGDLEQVEQLERSHYSLFEYGRANITRANYIAGKFVYEEWLGDEWGEVYSESSK